MSAVEGALYHTFCSVKPSVKLGLEFKVGCYSFIVSEFIHTTNIPIHQW